MTSLFNRLAKNTPAVFFLLFSFFFMASSCEKLKEKPALKIVSYEVLSDGSLKIRGHFLAGKKQAGDVGFCFGPESGPIYDSYYYSGDNGSYAASLDGDYFTAIIPGTYFKSYKPYYFRAYTTTDDYSTIYSDELYLASVQGAPVTPPCSPSDNFIDIGVVGGAETFYDFDMPDPDSWGSTYQIRANSNSHLFTFDFSYKPKTGVYTTANDAYGNYVHIYFYSGFISGSVQAGAPVYVNEVAKDKFEITLCAAPWKLNSTTLSMTAKLVCP